MLDVSSRCPSSSNSGPHGLNIAIYRRTPKPGRIFVESGPAFVIRYFPIAIASVQRLTARSVSFISRTSMIGNSFSFAPRPARRGLGFPLFERRTPRTIGRFCTRRRGPLSGAKNVGAVPQPTYERVARERRMQNPLIFERHLVLPGRPVFLSSKTVGVLSHSGCPLQRPIEDTTCCGFRRSKTQFAVGFKSLLYPHGNTDIVHMRTPRTCTLLPLFGGVGLAGSSHVTRRLPHGPTPSEGSRVSGTCPLLRFAR